MVLGVDVSKAMLKVARRNIRKVNADNIFHRFADATDTKLKSNFGMRILL